MKEKRKLHINSKKVFVQYVNSIFNIQRCRAIIGNRGLKMELPRRKTAKCYMSLVIYKNPINKLKRYG